MTFLGAEQVHSYVGRPVLYFQVQTPEIIHDWLTEPHTDWQRVKFTLFTVENLKGPRSSPFVLWHILWIKNNHAKAERRVFLLTVNIMYDKVLDPWNRSWLNWRCETTKTKESTGEYIQHINTDIYIFTANNNKKKTLQTKRSNRLIINQISKIYKKKIQIQIFEVKILFSP